MSSSLSLSSSRADFANFSASAWTWREGGYSVKEVRKRKRKRKRKRRKKRKRLTSAGTLLWTPSVNSPTQESSSSNILSFT